MAKSQAELNTALGNEKRAEVFKEINANPVEFNRTNNKHITEFAKAPVERKELKKQQTKFKHSGLKDWNERNRPGNNKK